MTLSDSNVEVVKGSLTPRFERIARAACPAFIRDMYHVRKSIFVLVEGFTIYWRNWRIEAKPGLISDLTSVPWVFFPLISKQNEHNSRDAGSALHDMFYMGLCNFYPDRPFLNKFLADWLAYDVWVASGVPKLEALVKFAVTVVLGLFRYRPDHTLAAKYDWVKVEHVATPDNSRMGTLAVLF